MRKKLLSMLALLLTVATGAWADGTCGNGVEWSLKDGQLTITKAESGTGVMTDYSSDESVPWYGDRDLITSVTIGEGVTNIGNNAFNGCSHLVKVNLSSVRQEDPEAEQHQFLTTIGKHAFWGCTSLTEFDIPYTVTLIDENAFYGCTSLTDVYCYVTAPELLTWNDKSTDDFRRPVGEEPFVKTVCHVGPGSKAAWDAAYGTGDLDKDVNVTFEEDMDEVGEWIYADPSWTFIMPPHAVEVFPIYEPDVTWKAGEVDVLNSTVNVYLGFEEATAPIVENPYNLPLTFFSSNPEVATVHDRTGEISYLKAGQATITALFGGNDSYGDGSFSFVVNVSEPATLTLAANPGELGKVTLESATEIVWDNQKLAWTKVAPDVNNPLTELPINIKATETEGVYKMVPGTEVTLKTTKAELNYHVTGWTMTRRGGGFFPFPIQTQIQAGDDITITNSGFYPDDNVPAEEEGRMPATSILALPIATTCTVTANFAENTYDVTFIPETNNKIQDRKAVVTVDGETKTLTSDGDNGTLSGLKAGQTVKVTANRGYKFRKAVTAKKGNAPIAVELTLKIGDVTIKYAEGDNWETVVGKNEAVLQLTGGKVTLKATNSLLAVGSTAVTPSEEVDPANEYQWVAVE